MAFLWIDRPCRNEVWIDNHLSRIFESVIAWRRWLQTGEVRWHPPFFITSAKASDDAFFSIGTNDLAVELLKANDFVLMITVGNSDKKMFADDALGFIIVKVRLPGL